MKKLVAFLVSFALIVSFFSTTPVEASTNCSQSRIESAFKDLREASEELASKLAEIAAKAAGDDFIAEVFRSYSMDMLISWAYGDYDSKVEGALKHLNECAAEGVGSADMVEMIKRLQNNEKALVQALGEKKQGNTGFVSTLWTNYNSMALAGKFFIDPTAVTPEDIAYSVLVVGDNARSGIQNIDALTPEQRTLFGKQLNAVFSPAKGGKDAFDKTVITILDQKFGFGKVMEGTEFSKKASESFADIWVYRDNGDFGVMATAAYSRFLNTGIDQMESTVNNVIKNIYSEVEGTNSSSSSSSNSSSNGGAGSVNNEDATTLYNLAYVYAVTDIMSSVLEGEPIDSSTSNPSKPAFSDMTNHWSKDSVIWAVEKGIVSGYTDGTFQPNKVVTEAEFLAMVVRGTGSVVDHTGITDWRQPYYSLAEHNEYPLAGITDTSKRDKPILRGAVAQTITTALGQKGLSEIEAAQFLLDKGLAKGKSSGNTVASFAIKDSLTRAEAVKFIQNMVQSDSYEQSK